MIRKVLVSLVLIVVILGAAMGTFKYLTDHRAKPQQGVAVSPAPVVDTLRLEPLDVREVFDGYGTARAERQATLAAEVNAAVIEIAAGVDEGAAVARGAVLLRLDDRQFQQELAEAEALIQSQEAQVDQLDVERTNLNSLLEIAQADAALNRAELDRVQRLFDRSNAPKTELDDARLQHQASMRVQQNLENRIALLRPQQLRVRADALAARARAERSRLNIDRCRIEAPFAGIVQAVLVDAGDRVQVGRAMLRLVSLDDVEIPIELAVSCRPRVAVGAQVDLHVESMPEIKWAGRIARIAPVADQMRRTFEIYVEVDNRRQAEPLLPGYFVKADVDGPVLVGAMVVPRRAIIDGRVFVVNGHAAHARAVTIERKLRDRVALGGDIRPGDEVIVSNLDMLFEGAKVRVAGEAAVAAEGQPGAGDVSSDGLLTRSKGPA